MIDKCLLQGVQLTVARKTLNRQHLFARNILEESQARAHGVALDDDRARTAEPFATAVLRSGERKVRAQYP